MITYMGIKNFDPTSTSGFDGFMNYKMSGGDSGGNKGSGGGGKGPGCGGTIVVMFILILLWLITK